MSVSVMCASTPAGVSEVSFVAIGTTNSILATRPEILAAAERLAKGYLAALDRAISRFRPDSEVCRLATAASNGPAAQAASPIFASTLRAAMLMAELTEGLVDFTLGSELVANGYDADIDIVRARENLPPAPSAALALPVRRSDTWRSVRLDPLTDLISCPAGVIIDLGASGKAHAADTIARRLAECLPGGFCVNLGGDIAVSGELPDDGWRIGVEDESGLVRQVVVSTGQAIATSSTRLRVWRTADGVTRHHIIDPHTGRPAARIWDMVTCAGATAVEANAASTAAVILGADAPEWLAAHGIPARLDHADGHVVVTPGWPSPRGPRS